MFFVVLTVGSVVTALSAAQPQTAEWDKYLWQTCRSSQIPQSASNLVTDLRIESQKILDAGPLAPLRTVYADLEQDPYFMYWQGGRIVTTLAMAWPHLTPPQRNTVRKYVRDELADPLRAPWNLKGFIPPDIGSRRELHTFHEPRGWDRYWSMWGHNKPTMGALYGLWLYADRSGDWEPIRANYSQLTKLYARKTDECGLYGTMGAHIAMARIARHLKDDDTLALATSNAFSAFQAGTNFAAVEVATRKYWKERYEPRQVNLVYQGWMFLDLCPEVGRYLSDYLKEETLRRNALGLQKYPLFWLREVPYWSRWTGDEGLGIPTELMGMIVPVERWVANAPAEKLEIYTRSAPISIGDCYWLEALVMAIEAAGKTEWIHVRP
jgi:hypothetical protein